MLPLQKDNRRGARNSKIDQARRIANQYHANFNEVYDLLKQGKSAAAVSKKMKKRWEKQYADLDLVMEVLSSYSHDRLRTSKAVNEAAAEQILEAANSGSTDDVVQFVMTKVNEASRSAFWRSWLVFVVVGSAVVVSTYATVVQYNRGKVGMPAIIMCVLTLLMCLLLEFISFLCRENTIKYIIHGRCLRETRKKWRNDELMYQLAWRNSRVVLERNFPVKVNSVWDLFFQ